MPETRIDPAFPDVPEIVQAYRAAHRALERLVSDGGFAFVPESRLSAEEVIGQFPELLAQADSVVVAQLGPVTDWTAPLLERGLPLVVAGIDLDAGGRGFGVKFGESAAGGFDPGSWHGSALDQAGRAYKRAAGWDFPPGEAGVWILMLAPEMGVGGDDGPWSWRGRIAGFAVVYDRDEDGRYEAVGHVWTALAWRRRGIARRLLEEAVSRFGVKVVEEPYTDSGTALVESCFPGEGSGD